MLKTSRQIKTDQSKKTYNILIIEDEKFLCGYYLFLIKEMEEEMFPLNFKIKICNNFNSANEEILINSESEVKFQYDLVFLDLRLRNCKLNVTHDGLELGIILRRYIPRTKIFILSFYDSHRKLHAIFKKINPEGYWVKNELTSSKFFKNGIIDLLKGVCFYCPSVISFLKNKGFDKTELNQDDRDILFYLSNGFTNKEITKLLPFSQSGIERRKRNIRKVLNIADNGNSELIKIAREKNIIQ